MDGQSSSIQPSSTIIHSPQVVSPVPSTASLPAPFLAADEKNPFASLVLRGPGTDQDSTFARSPLLVKLDKHSHELLALGRSDHTQSQSSPSEVEVLSKEELLERIHRSANFIAAAHSFIAAAKELGSNVGSRLPDEGEAILPIAIREINQRIPDRRSAGENTLASAANNPKNLSTPNWVEIAALSGCLLSVGSKTNGASLPNPLSYLERVLPKAETEKDRNNYQILEVSIKEATARDPTGLTAASFGGKLASLRGKLDEKLQKLAIDLKTIPSCYQALHLEINPSLTFGKRLRDFSEGLGKLISLVAVDSTDTEIFQELCEMRCTLGAPKESGVTPIESLSVGKIGINLALDESSRISLLAEILPTYIKVREILREVCGSFEEPAVNDHTLKHRIKSFETILETPFPGEIVENRRTLMALATIDNPIVQDCMPELLTMKMGKAGVKTLLHDSVNLELIEPVMEILLYGNARSTKLVGEGLTMGELTSAASFGGKIRKYLESRDLVRLARFFDEELDRVSGNSKAKPDFYQRMFLLYSLVLVTDERRDQDVSRGLKSHFKDPTKIQGLITAINKSLTGEQSAHAKTIASLEIKLNKTLKPTLSNYYGQHQMLSKIMPILEDNQRLLAKKDLWFGLEPSNVVWNGLLIHGGPGGGKTYGMECIFNTLGVPLTVIDRGELVEAFRKDAEARAKKQKQDERIGIDVKKPETEEEANSLGHPYFVFMMKKIRELKDNMNKSGAVMGGLGMDEVETEFFDRRGGRASRNDNIDTNVMLTIQAKLIHDYYDIMFIAASNYIEQVDPAALRFGRFGFKFHVTAPSAEDAADIIRGSMSELLLDVPKGFGEASPQVAMSSSIKQDVSGISDLHAAKKKLEEECVGTTPLLIKMAINRTVALRQIDNAGVKPPVDLALYKDMISAVMLLKELGAMPNGDSELSPAMDEEGSRH